MSGNTFGKLLKLTTCGESHGRGLMGILDGLPSNIPIDLDAIQHDIDRRKPGQSKFTTQRKEEDKIEVFSGLFEGKTTGTSIGFLIHNKDQRSKDYSDIAQKFRPGHADYTYFKKYGHRDYRGGGRSSARETAMRVAGGAFVKQFLAQKNIHIQGYVSQIGHIKAEQIALDFVETNPFFFPDAQKISDLENLLNETRKNKDSIGAKITCLANGVPPGLGEPVFDKLSAALMHAIGSINAVKGVEIGEGFSCITQQGSAHRDQMHNQGFISNRAGGILGGISTGEPIVLHAAFKPTSSIAKEGQTIDTSGANTTIVTKGRHDPCVGIRAVPIVEAMMALSIGDFYLQQQALKPSQ